jgi:hypothetical protein
MFHIDRSCRCIVRRTYAQKAMGGDAGGLGAIFRRALSHSPLRCAVLVRLIPKNPSRAHKIDGTKPHTTAPNATAMYTVT